MYIYNFKPGIAFIKAYLFLLILVASTLNVTALEFKKQLSPGLVLKYKHWNEKKQKITGYTIIEHKRGNKNEILIVSENINQKGEAYSNKKLWFVAETGKLIKYEETDLRNKLSVKDVFSEGTIKSYVKKANEEKTFTIKEAYKLVPFEVIDLAMQQKVPDVVKKHKIELVLYLPLIAFELETNHLPVSLSELEVAVTIRKIKVLDTIFGKKKCAMILIEPTSFWVKTLLPEEKTRFNFIFLAEAPGYLLEFQQGEVKLQLESVTLN